MSSKDYIQSRR